MELNNLVKYKGFVVRTNTSDVKTIKEVVENKGYERSNFKIENGERWLDMGGCIGAFSCYAAEKGAHVTCFEPLPEHIFLIKTNIIEKKVQDYVTLVEGGIDIKEGQAVIYEHTTNGNSWRSSFEKKRRGSIEHKVPIVNVDNYLSDDICLKIDIEGTEKRIIEHLIETGSIKLVKKLVFEWTFDVNTKTKDFLNVIQSLSATHYIYGITENYLSKLSEYEDYPMSWFPACKTVFCLKK